MRKVNWLAFAVPVIAFVVYLFTLYPTVGWVDCGEISAGCYMLNVLHPTGYPLFTLIGYLFSHIPLGTVATRVNALSALFSSLAALFCFLTVLKLTRSQVAGIVTAALFAFSFTVWNNSVDADVFGLTAFYVSLTVYLLVRLGEVSRKPSAAPTPDPRPRTPLLLLLAYMLGLALTNHMSFASTFVGAMVSLLVMFRGDVLKPRVLLPLVLAFLLGLSPYLCLLIRSQAQPLMNWGNAHNLQRLIWHVTGKQYQVWMFSLPFSDIMKNLGKALGLLGQEQYFVMIPVAAWGAWRLRKQRREIFWLLIVIFALNIAYAVNYSIPDIQSYYIPFMTAAFIFTGVGLADLLRRLKRVPQYAFLLLVILPVAVNLRRAGAQGNHISEDFGRNHMVSAPDSAIVMTTNWDIYSPAFYLRHINLERPDLCMIDKELLRRTWYFQSLQLEYPWLVERSRNEIDNYLRFLDQFEHGTLRDVKGIQDAYIAMINSFVTRNPERRSFITFDDRTDNDAKSILPARLRVPRGLLYELRSDLATDSFDYRQFRLRIPNLQLDERTQLNLRTYERFANERAALLKRLGRDGEAAAVMEWLATIRR
jgi:hypothetical protein